MTKQHWIGELKQDHRVRIEVRLKNQAVRTTKGNAPFLLCEISDRTGCLIARRFNPSADEIDAFPTLAYAVAEGHLNAYNGEAGFVASAAFLPLPNPCADDFEPCSPLGPAVLQERLEAHIAAIGDSRLRALVSFVYRKSTISDSLESFPAAVAIHHAFRHGLLHHTLEVADAACAIADAQQRWGWHCVNRDLVATGALLHDIGKAQEYEKRQNDYSRGTAGRLLGHIVLGQTFLARCIATLRKREVAFPEELEWQVLHLIASHHGQGEWGSPVAPMTAEACIVHMADKISADLFQFQEAHGAGRPEGAQFVRRPMLDSGFGHSGRDVFVGDLPTETAPPSPARPDFAAIFGTPRLELVHATGPRSVSLPILRIVDGGEAEDGRFASRVSLVGRIAAGTPLQDSAFAEGHEWIENGPAWSGSGSCFLLRVRGESMIGDGIRDGDLILVRHQNDADHGEIVVAMIDGRDATVKRLERKSGKMRLLPSNPNEVPITIKDGERLDIQGVVVAIARRDESESPPLPLP